MNKRVIFALAFLLLVPIFASLISAQNETTVEGKAYACLENKIGGKCDSFSTEEKIFSLLATGQCRTNLVSDSLAQECWPSSGCKVRTTAQAVLALSKVGTNTKEAEEWLLSQSVSNPNIDWFLQVESSNATSCTAIYDGISRAFSLRSDKTLSSNAGSCLTRYQDYWFKIDSSCYNDEIEISCSNSFLTSLLYKRTNSDTLYISDETHSASGSGSTTETARSECFREGGSCNYEATLWATTVLKYRGYNETSSYMPYLISMIDDNSHYLPESFLYTLSGNFRTELLIKQRENKWWAESGDSFYDTAVALLPFQNEEITEKTNAKSWLAEVQSADGCWQGNVRNTAFLLYSLWPKKFAPTNLSSGIKDCADSGYFCMPEASCESVEGTVLSNYQCTGAIICCNKQKPLLTCAQQSGELCDSDESCIDGNDVSSSDTTTGKFCCVGGECGIPETSQCQNNLGACKSFCGKGEGVAPYSCLSSSQVCCIQKKQSSALLIILLSLLIILTALAIIFRKKIKDFFTKLKLKLKRKPSSPAGRYPVTSPSSRVYPGAIPRRILPSTTQRTYPVKRSGEVSEVLRKLKAIINPQRTGQTKEVPVRAHVRRINK